MTSVCPNWDLDTIVRAMHAHGYAGLEPRVAWDHAAGIETSLSGARRAEIRGQFRSEGLEICCIATGVRMATTASAERQRHLDDARAAIELAGDLGCPRMRVFGGPRYVNWQPHHLVAHVVDGFRELLPAAEAAGVTLMLETHDHWSASAPVAAVVAALDSPRVRALWDIMHPQRMMETPHQTFSTIGAVTAHLHAHDARYNSSERSAVPDAAIGTGVIDHATPLDLLAATDFDGYFSVEVIHKKDETHDADAVLQQYAEWFRASPRSAGK
jgi:sugar phosphate isomerase/epimerase